MLKNVEKLDEIYLMPVENEYAKPKTNEFNCTLSIENIMLILIQDVESLSAEGMNGAMDFCMKIQNEINKGTLPWHTLNINELLLACEDNTNGKSLKEALKKRFLKCDNLEHSRIMIGIINSIRV